MRTSFHHQPEAQHPKYSAIHKPPSDYPILVPRRSPAGPSLNPSRKSSTQTVVMHHTEARHQLRTRRPMGETTRLAKARSHVVVVPDRPGISADDAEPGRGAAAPDAPRATAAGRPFTSSPPCEVALGR